MKLARDIALLASATITLAACFVPQTGYDGEGNDCITIVGADPISLMYRFADDSIPRCTKGNRMIEAKSETKHTKYDETQRIAMGAYAAQVFYPDLTMRNNIAKMAAGIMFNMDKDRAKLSYIDCRRMSIQNQLAADLLPKVGLGNIYTDIASTWSRYYSDHQMEDIQITAKKLEARRSTSAQVDTNSMLELAKDLAPQPSLDIAAHSIIFPAAQALAKSNLTNSSINNYEQNAANEFPLKSMCQETYGASVGQSTLKRVR